VGSNVLAERRYQGDLVGVEKHLEWPKAKAQAAVSHAEAFPDETNRALEENRAMDFTALKRMLPKLQSSPQRSAR
jgi:hypothetical protein